MVPNGDLAHALLFGIFGIFAVLGQRIIDRRKQRLMGPVWHRLQNEVRRAPNLGLALVSLETAVRLIIAGLLYGLLLWSHPWLFGVNPIV